MPVTPTYPGVYVQEVSSGVHTISGVGTSIALFIGTSTKAPASPNVPVECLNYSAFAAQFNDANVANDPQLDYYVRLFFLNGGTDCWVYQIPGSSGSFPDLSDYATAFLTPGGPIDKNIDLFNLLVLPPSTGSGAIDISTVYGDALTFCDGKRAFLLMDPPSSWTTTALAISGVPSLRPGGADNEFGAVFFPQITINNNGTATNIGPAGALAGMFARIDGTRGVWKAPAGLEASILGITGLEQRLSDGESGILNPVAVNALRIFPSGIVCWGARTLDGFDVSPSETDYKYIPVRRFASFIEVSLQRGLQWVVFEPNDEPLWAQIRLNVGAFMHDLFRNHAFQGATPKDAYFVKCDSETTTQSDINNGIVNIWVGFAPLKPAEFVILYLQQMAGNIGT